MQVAAAVFALLAGALHGFIFVLESVWWRRPTTWRRFGVATQELADANAQVMFNQGFYNLFLGIGAITGAGCLLAGTGDDTATTTVGWSLLVFTCGCMLGAAAVLRTAGKAYTRPAVTQALFPGLGLVCAAAALALR